MASGLSKISGERWTSHLKSIFTSTRDNMCFPSDSLTQGPLDYEISVDELLIASHILKPNKASGHDSISNDMIGCLLEVNLIIVVKLFNTILAKNALINAWIVITPI